MDLGQRVERRDLRLLLLAHFVELPLAPLHALAHHALVLEVNLVPAVELVDGVPVLEVVEDVVRGRHLPALLLQPSALVLDPLEVLPVLEPEAALVLPVQRHVGDERRVLRARKTKEKKNNC